MTVQEFDVRKITRDLINSEWSLSEDPDVFIDDDTAAEGTATRKPLEIEIKSGEDLGLEYSGIGANTVDIQNSAIVIIRSTEGNLYEYWEEVQRIFTENVSDVDGLPGGWNVVRTDTITPAQVSFVQGTFELTVTYEKYNADTGQQF